MHDVIGGLLCIAIGRFGRLLRRRDYEIAKALSIGRASVYYALGGHPSFGQAGMADARVGCVMLLDALRRSGYGHDHFGPVCGDYLRRRSR
jgi:hypothetical protein